MSLNKNHPRSSRFYRGMASSILLLTLVVSAFPGSSASAVTCKFKHEVQPGDTLLYVGNLYGVGWLEIAKANNIGSPYVITVGQKLCIPGGTKPTTTTTTSTTGKKKAASLEIIPGLGHILVSVENFSPRTVYNVRLFSQRFHVYYRIGHFKTNKEGDFTGWFKIPGYVPRSPDMAVCVKNVETDAVSCLKYQDPYSPVPFLGIGCNKSAR